MSRIYYHRKLNLKLLLADRLSNSAAKTKDIAHRFRWYDQIPYVSDVLDAAEVVIDGGAYIGDSTTYFLSKGCMVYAFEPNAEPYECLVYNCPGCIPIQRPLGKRSEKVYMAWANPQMNNVGAQAYRLTETSLSGQLPVLEIDLDSFLHLSSCGFIKLDVQGSESRVLQNGKLFIERFKPMLALELEDDWLKKQGSSLAELMSIIDQMGYKEVHRTRRDGFYVHADKL